ncbi:MAG: hypothetical protein EBU52_15460 [Cytophagia bacterium]|nr:hypothetical protein [Cytophagia bacterium]
MLVFVAGLIVAIHEWAVAEAWKASYHLQTTLLLGISVWVSVRKLLVIQTPSTFTTVYLVSIVLQLLVWLGYVAFVFYSDQEGIKANAVYFLINCLIFITLQVLFLFSKKGK